MAIAKIRTLLSLDRYARIMGINPAHFSGGNQIELASGAYLFPLDNAQNDIWPQYAWQNADQCSREELAQTIYTAEQEIVQYLGYYPTPVWIESERHDLPTHYRPELRYTKLTRDVTGNDTTVKTNYGHFIRGGRRAVSLIEAGITVTYWDLDSDGWDEFAAINVTVPAGVSPSEIKLYFVGQSADPLYEIRDFKSKALSGNILTFGFESWKLIQPALFELYPTNNGTEAHVELIDPSNFVVTVDAYREYNDHTRDHATFYSQSPDDETYTTQGGFMVTNTSDNFVMPIEGSYSASLGEWVRAESICAYPDYVDLWYYSGMRNRPGKHPYSDDYLPDDIAIAIAYMATARLEKIFYANNNATALASRLREYWNESVRDGMFRMPPADSTTNPFGARKGEWEAWRRISRYKTQQRSGGAL